MVKEVLGENRKLFSCEECGLVYEEQKWAEKCQAWCSEHHSCNLGIIKYAVKEEGNDHNG